MSIPTLLSEVNVQALGWMLIHFLWQGLVVAAVLAGTRILQLSSRLRYTIACVALLVMVFLPLVTFLSYSIDKPSGLPPSRYAN